MYNIIYIHIFLIQCGMTAKKNIFISITLNKITIDKQKDTNTQIYLVVSITMLYSI